MDPKETSKKNIGVVLRVLLFCLGCAIILATASALTKGMSPVKSNILSIGIAFSFTLLLTLPFAKWEKLKLEQIGLIPNKRSINRLLIGLLMGSILATLQTVFVLMNRHVTVYRSTEINIAGIASALVLYLLVALREEVAFRAYPLRALNYAEGPFIAQVIIALVFIIEHKIGGMTWLQAIIGPGIGALFFGTAALKTKGLALPIGLHTAWNFMQWSLGFKPETGVYQIKVEKGFETTIDLIGWISYVAVMTLGIFLLVIWSRKASTNQTE